MKKKMTFALCFCNRVLTFLAKLLFAQGQQLASSWTAPRRSG